MIEEDKMIRGLLAYARKHDCKGWREMHYKFTANELHQHYLAFFRELQVKNCSIPDVGRSLPVKTLGHEEDCNCKECRILDVIFGK